MSRIPDHVLDQIRQRTDLLALVREVVDLKSQGSDWFGPQCSRPEPMMRRPAKEDVVRTAETQHGTWGGVASWPATRIL